MLHADVVGVWLLEASAALPARTSLVLFPTLLPTLRHHLGGRPYLQPVEHRVESPGAKACFWLSLAVRPQASRFTGLGVSFLSKYDNK